MDEDLIAVGGIFLIFLIFLAFPFLTILAITGGVAYSRTKAWDKARKQASIKLESESAEHLVADSDDSDFYDTEDEEEHNKRKAEKEADAFLTFRQKFRKEFRKVWSGKGREQMVKEKERKERRKLAKAVARELVKIERRKARKAQMSGQRQELPPYKKE